MRERAASAALAAARTPRPANWLAGRIAVAAIAAAACSTEPEAPHGSPVLVAVWWVTAGTGTQVWGADADGAGSPLPPGASEVDFVFDRRLDGSRIEDTVGGMTAPKANPPVTVTWTDLAPGGDDSPFASVFYNSVGLYGAGSSYVFLRPRLVGFPASTPLTFGLDPSGLTSAYGEPMIGPATLDVSTAPLAVIPRSSSGPDTVPASFQLPVKFNGRPGSPAELSTFMHARADGVDMPAAIAADVADPTVIHVAPGCPAGWPAGTTVEVTFDAGLPDAFGVPTAASLTGGMFRVAGAAGAGGASGPCAVKTGG